MLFPFSFIYSPEDSFIFKVSLAGADGKIIEYRMHAAIRIRSSDTDACFSFCVILLHYAVRCLREAIMYLMCISRLSLSRSKSTPTINYTVNKLTRVNTEKQIIGRNE